MKYIYVKDEWLLTAASFEEGCENPEDMIWEREISDVFWAGVKAGRMTKSNNEIEVLDKEKEG
jgi:hypothetical protein